MKIQCPSCQNEIPAEDVNLAEGVAQCRVCDEIVGLGISAPEADTVPAVEKPVESRIESYVTPDEMGIILPALGMRGGTWFFLFFTVIWNASAYLGFLAAMKSGEFGGMFFMLPFIGVGAITFCIFLYLLKSEVSILIDCNTISVSRTIFGKSFTKTRAFGDLSEVEKVGCYRSNKRPVYGVGLRFSKGRCLKFGSNLKEAEKLWLLSEITRFWKG